MPNTEWERAKETGDTGLAVSHSVEEYLAERMETLTQRLNSLNEQMDELEGVTLENGDLHVDRLDPDVPEAAKTLSRTLYAMLPRVKLTDLLLEVSHWTAFDQQLVHSATGQAPSPAEKPIMMASLMALGTNIGLTKMAEAAPGISYRQIAHVAQWRMDDDTLRRAQATLVNFHHRLPLASTWGEGTTSSSDGMRMSLGVSSLYADANPHYGFGKGATIYRFTSDQGTAFAVQVVTTNSRDACVNVCHPLLPAGDPRLPRPAMRSTWPRNPLTATQRLFRYLVPMPHKPRFRSYIFGKPGKLVSKCLLKMKRFAAFWTVRDP